MNSYKSYKKLDEGDRNHKYNSITKIKKVLGNGQPSVDKVKAFIKKEFDLDNEDHQDIVGDIMGFYHLDPEEFFDEDGNLLEGAINEAKTFGDVYEIATPNPTSTLVNALKKSKILKNADIVTNFDSPDGLESVLIFGINESDVAKIQDEFGDVLAFKYSLTDRIEILEESAITEGLKQEAIKASNDMFSAFIKYRKYLKKLNNSGLDEDFREIKETFQDFDDRVMLAASLLKESKDSALMVTPSTDKDFKALKKWLDKSDCFAEVEKGYFIFPEEDLDALEMELTKDFDKAGISASFEAM